MFTAIRHTNIHRLTWAAPMALAALAAACGDDKAPERPAATVSVATTHPVQPPAPPTTPATFAANRTAAEGAGAMGTDVATMPATYENADDLYKAGRFSDAAGVFGRYVEANPNKAMGFYMLGLSRWKAGDFDGAKQALDRSIDLNPAFARSYFNEARVLLSMQRGPEALEQVQEGLSIDSASAEGWLLKARAQAVSGDIDSATRTYHELLARNDADPWALNNLGVLLLDTGDFQGALGPLARLVLVQPTSPIFQNNFGMALERSGYPVAALHHYEQAVRNDSTYTKAMKNADRLRAGITDTTTQDEVSVDSLAEAFRQKVKTWKEVAVPAGALQVPVKPDTALVKDDSMPRTTGNPGNR